MNYWSAGSNVAEASVRSGSELEPRDGLDDVIAECVACLKRQQSDDGVWSFEVEADATIPAEYILLEHYLDEIDPDVEARLARYLRSVQGEHGGWPLHHGGEFNVSASVKAYFALKLAGDDPNSLHMQRAREAILSHGGAANCNVFTRITPALFGQVPWRAVPTMPAEIIFLPKWFPFHLDKISYWSRTVLVPLLVIMALKPRAKNPRAVGIDELFCVPPGLHRTYLVNPTKSRWGDALLLIDRILKIIEPAFPMRSRVRAIAACIDWMRPRLNGEDGLGGIFPAIVNSLMAMKAVGYPSDHPDVVVARRALRKLVVVKGDIGYCQPCVSPVWDVALAVQAMMAAGETASDPAVRRALNWLRSRQVTDVVGDWAVQRPNLRPGGWPFQYRNDFYPDVDDTAAVAIALDGARRPEYREAVLRAAEWVLGMQSKCGGWGSFDADNTHMYLRHIPFADHGALLDPPTADITARCVSFLSQLGYDRDHPAVSRGLAYLEREQEPDGSWFGRWGSNYIYGTWSALSAFNAAGIDHGTPAIRKAVAWLLSRQNDDGGWGESAESYWEHSRNRPAASTASQTSWALLALMAAGEVRNQAVERGVAFLLQHRRRDGRWHEPWYTGVGFPRVFYLRYHGYAQYFPLWALGRYRSLNNSNSTRVVAGM